MRKIINKKCIIRQINRHARTHECMIRVVLTLCGLCCMTASLPMLGPPLKHTTIFSSNTAHIRVNISVNITIIVTIIKMTNHSKVVYLFMSGVSFYHLHILLHFYSFIYLFIYLYLSFSMYNKNKIH